MGTGGHAADHANTIGKVGDRTAARALVPIVLIGVTIHLAVIFGAQRYAAHQVASRERLIGNGVAASINAMLEHVRTRRQAELNKLAGLPCREVRESLAALQTQVLYTRDIDLVANGRVYCSSGLGLIDVPLSIYGGSEIDGTHMSLLPDTPFQPNTPVIALFDQTGKGEGVLYIIEGAYIADELARAVSYGAQTAAFSVYRGGALKSDHTFVPVLEPSTAYAASVASEKWPFSIVLSASKEFVPQMRWKYLFLFGAFGVLLKSLLATTYLLAFAPRRLLLGAVRRALRHGELYLVYQPIIDVRNRALVGVEALLRWKHPKWGQINPNAFMSEVERVHSYLR